MMIGSAWTFVKSHRANRFAARAAIMAAALTFFFQARATHADLPGPQKAPDSPQFVSLVDKARQSLSIGDRESALVYMKIAVGMEPANAIARAELGIALLESGDYANAENQLRIARRQGARDELTVLPLFEAMLTLGESRTFLDIFEDPGGARTPLAAMVLRARAAALQTLGNSAGAWDAMTRSLKIARDLDTVLTGSRIA